MGEILSFTFKFDDDDLSALESRIEGRLDEIVQKMAQDTADFIDSNWSAVSPSEPGNPPAIVTGTLRDSVEIDSQGRDLKGRFASSGDVRAWAIRVTAPYAGYLEPPGWLDRPYFQPAIDNTYSRISEYFGGFFNV